MLLVEPNVSPEHLADVCARLDSCLESATQSGTLPVVSPPESIDDLNIGSGQKHYAVYRYQAEGTNALSAADANRVFAAIETPAHPLSKNSVMRFLARHLSLGRPFDWESYYQKNAIAKMSLPTYPFSRDCYWLEDAIEESACQKQSA